MRYYDYDVTYDFPDHGYRRAEPLEKYIDDELTGLAGKFHVPKPMWGWTGINTHFEPKEQVISISDYIVDIWNRRPEYQDDIKKAVAWETAHEFKHYLDNYRFLTGDPRGRKVIRHIERRRLLKLWFDLYRTVPEFEEDAVLFATQATHMNEHQYDSLYSKIQPWNIPGYTVPE